MFENFFSFDWLVGDENSAFSYLNKNQFAADVVKGAAGAGSQYLLEQYKAKEAEKLARQKNQWENERYYAKAPAIDLNAYANSSLTSRNTPMRGLLTNN